MSESRPLRTIPVVNLDTGLEVQVKVADRNAEQFAARFKKVAKERRKWAKKNDVYCYRVYDSDLPDFAVAIDRYDGVWESQGMSALVVAEYQAPRDVDPYEAEDRLYDAMDIAAATLGIPRDLVFAKTRRHERGGGQYVDQQKDAFVMYTEDAGNVFEIDLGSYLDTGIFLDHRATRIMVGEMAQGTRFLNLFSYTGTCTVHAAVGGAVSTTTVDMSQTYLNWAKRNMELNGCTGEEHTYVRTDAMNWLRQVSAAGKNKYDLVFVDPPTFSNSKTMGKATWSVQRDHVEMLTMVSKLLAPGGKAVFSCNLRTFKPDNEELERRGIHLEDISAGTIPHDFQRNPRIHKCYILTVE